MSIIKITITFASPESFPFHDGIPDIVNFTGHTVPRKNLVWGEKKGLYIIAWLPEEGEVSFRAAASDAHKTNSLLERTVVSPFSMLLIIL